MAGSSILPESGPLVASPGPAEESAPPEADRHFVTLTGGGSLLWSKIIPNSSP